MVVSTGRESSCDAWSDMIPASAHVMPDANGTVVAVAVRRPSGCAFSIRLSFVGGHVGRYKQRRTRVIAAQNTQGGGQIAMNSRCQQRNQRPDGEPHLRMGLTPHQRIIAGAFPISAGLRDFRLSDRQRHCPARGDARATGRSYALFQINDRPINVTSPGTRRTVVMQDKRT